MNKIRLHKRVREIVSKAKLEYSSPEIQRNIQEYGVLVDAVLEYKRLLWVEDFQEISIEHWPRDREELVDSVPIFFQDEDIFVFDKPFGLVVQPGVGHLHNHLVGYIHHHFPTQRNLPDCGLAHRLDINTQGLILVAKNLETYNQLKQKFKQREIKKSYLALVHGSMNHYDLQYYQTRSLMNPTKQTGYIDQSVAEHKHNKVRFCHTIFHPILYCSKLKQTLVRVQIKTGRTHQIRVSAEMLGHPLVADTIYTSKINKVPEYKTNQQEHYNSEEADFNKIVKHIAANHNYCLVSNSLEFSLSKQYCFEKFNSQLE